MQNRVNEIRKEKGWTLRSLARETGYSKTTINNIERGNTNPRIDTLELIANTLGVSVNELLVQKRTVKTSDYPQKTKEEYLAELQEVFLNMDICKVRYFTFS